MKKYTSLLFLLISLVSCNEYQKAFKNEDVGVKFGVADKLYTSGKYGKSIRLLEQIAPTYRGKPQGEKVFYMLSQSYYKTEQFTLAAYQFESFVSNYPKSDKLEEAAFLGAKCYSKLSPIYSIDQRDTNKAIEKLQEFIDNYSSSPYLVEANELMRTLSDKIEKKVYENAKGYHTISDYKSAIVALENFVVDYPGTKYKEDALFYKLDSAYQLGINSIESKKEERLNAAKKAYTSLIRFKPDTQYKAKADEMLARVEQDLQKNIK